MKILLKSVFLVVLLSVLSGCASIVSKSNWPLTIVTNPKGAKVEISDRYGFVVYRGVTPASMSLRASSEFFMKESYSIKLSLDGFADRIIPLECKINGWYFGNIFIGVIGMLIVDPLTGAMFKLDKEYIYESFEKPEAGINGNAVKILNINDIPEKMKEHLVALK